MNDNGGVNELNKFKSILVENSTKKDSIAICGLAFDAFTFYNQLFGYDWPVPTINLFHQRNRPLHVRFDHKPPHYSSISL